MRFFFKFLLVFGLLFDSSLSWGRTITKTLYMGLTQEVKVRNMPKELSDDLNYNRSIVKISIAKKLGILRFEPVKPGRTNFKLRDSKGRVVASYKIYVRQSSLAGKVRQIKSLLADIEGIQIKVVNGRILIDGEILLPRDMNRIYSVVAQFGKSASSIVTMSPLAQKKIARLIERDIGNPDIHVRAVNEKFILEGTANSEAEKNKAEIIAKTYVPDVVVEAAEAAQVIRKRRVNSVINLLNVKSGPPPQPGKMIKLIVHYVELKKDYTKGFRFQWMPTLSDNSGVQFSGGSRDAGSGVIGAITGTISDLLPKLNFAKAHGHARVLQSSSIIVQDGSPGIVKSVTKIPFPAQNAYGQITTRFAEAGLDTNITPSLVSARSSSINLNIMFTLSSYLGKTEAGPMMSNRTIQTRVVVSDSQSAAVGGLVSSSQSMGYNRLPAGAKANPIVSLYASKEFQKDQSQFVVFVTPVVMASASEGSDAIKRKFRLRR